jgi:hypothetical protein
MGTAIDIHTMIRKKCSGQLLQFKHDASFEKEPLYSVELTVS